MAGRVISLFLVLLVGCAATGGATPDHKPMTAVFDGGVHSRCEVTKVRIVNNIVHLEC